MTSLPPKIPSSEAQVLFSVLVAVACTAAALSACSSSSEVTSFGSPGPTPERLGVRELSGATASRFLQTSLRGEHHLLEAAFDPVPQLWAQLPVLGLAAYVEFEKTGQGVASPRNMVTSVLRDPEALARFRRESLIASALWLKEAACKKIGPPDVLKSHFKQRGSSDSFEQWLSRVAFLIFVPLHCEKPDQFPPDPQGKLLISAKQRLLGLMLVLYQGQEAPLVAGVVTEFNADGYAFLEGQLVGPLPVSDRDLVDPDSRQTGPCDLLGAMVFAKYGPEGWRRVRLQMTKESHDRFWNVCPNYLRSPAAAQELIRRAGTSPLALHEDKQQEGMARALLEDLGHEVASKRELAAGELIRMGSAAVPLLVGELEDGYPSRYDYPGKEATRSYEERLRRLRMAVQTLGRMGSTAAPAVPALLILAKKSSAKDIPSLIAEALASIGISALPQVKAALQDEESLLSEVAGDALWRMGEPALEPLLDVLQSCQKETICDQTQVSLQRMIDYAGERAGQQLADNEGYGRAYTSSNAKKLAAILIQRLCPERHVPNSKQALFDSVLARIGKPGRLCKNKKKPSN